MLAALGSMSQDVVEGFGTETTGDDHRQTQLLAERFQGVCAEAAKVLHSIGRRNVCNAMLASRLAFRRLLEGEMRGEHLVVRFLFHDE